MQIIRCNAKRIGMKKRGVITMYFVKLDVEEKNHMESDIIPDIFFNNATYYISATSYYVMTGRSKCEFEFKVEETGSKLIKLDNLINGGMSKFYCRNNELRKKFLNDIIAIIRKTRVNRYKITYEKSGSRV